MTSPLTPDLLDSFAKRVEADPTALMMQNALASTDVDKVVQDHARTLSVARSMSHHLDDWDATDQKQSGRCWMFAGLNLLRAGVATRLDVKEFEFSQSYLQFWDKLEKANHWLESILATADRDVDDRTVAHLLATPAEDGGQWNMFLALVAKHGLVPKEVMPETQSSSRTDKLNRDISAVLRRAAQDLRARHATGATAEELAEAKEEVLAAIHRMLSLHLGTPPRSFVWQWRDKDKGFHRDGELASSSSAT
jgi:bleomycin hydrolase